MLISTVISTCSSCTGGRVVKAVILIQKVKVSKYASKIEQIVYTNW